MIDILAKTPQTLTPSVQFIFEVTYRILTLNVILLSFVEVQSNTDVINWPEDRGQPGRVI